MTKQELAEKGYAYHDRFATSGAAAATVQYLLSVNWMVELIESDGWWEVYKRKR